METSLIAVPFLLLIFDIPLKYITEIITEKGAFRPRDLKKLTKKDVRLEKMRLKP